MWSAEYKLNPDNPNITATVNAQFAQELTNNGFYVDADDPNGGIYSPTSEGIFENFAFKTEADVETTKVTTASRYNKHLKNLQDSFNYIKNAKNLPGRTLVDKALSIPPGKSGSILSAQDVIGAYENQQFSSEIILKARLLNMDPAELLERSKDALLNSRDPNDKEIVRIYDLKKDVIPNPEKLIKETIKNSVHSDMLYLLNRKGIDQLTQNQYRRLLETEDAFQGQIGRTDEVVENEKIREKIIEKRNAQIQENQATITVDSFSATNERSDEEIEQQFNAQPGIF